MILLPRTTAEGIPRISYSQLNTWIGEKAFNQVLVNNKLTEISGTTGYILKYFEDFAFPPSPMDIYAPFGQKVEDAICEQNYQGFDVEEIKILKSIKPIGTFQREVNIDFGEFIVYGLIDDCNEDQSYLRDYKTASKNSMKQYATDSYKQLDIYALDRYKKTGELPDKMEVCVILRGGSHFKPPLKVVGVDYIDRSTDVGRLLYIEASIKAWVKEISDAYKVYLKIKELV